MKVETVDQATAKTEATGRVDSEVVATAKRRSFTAENKVRIVREAACRGPGEIAAPLRRDGPYPSNLVTWRRAVAKGSLGALALVGAGPRPRGSIRSPSGPPNSNVTTKGCTSVSTKPRPSSRSKKAAGDPSPDGRRSREQRAAAISAIRELAAPPVRCTPSWRRAARRASGAIRCGATPSPHNRSCWRRSHVFLDFTEPAERLESAATDLATRILTDPRSRRAPASAVLTQPLNQRLIHVDTLRTTPWTS